nr:unnamed protein product [Digitaria exilis]
MRAREECGSVSVRRATESQRFAAVSCRRPAGLGEFLCAAAASGKGCAVPVRIESVTVPNCSGKQDERMMNVKQEESTGCIPSPLLSGIKPKKRLTSKVWDDFIPTFINGKVAQAKCMHCHQVFNCNGTSGTTGLRNHQAKCSPGTHKRPRLQEPTSLPSTQQNMVVASSDPKQKKLPVLLSSHKKGLGTVDAMPERDLALIDTHINTDRKNMEVDQNRLDEELATGKQNTLTLPVISTDKNKKNQGVDHNISHEELVRALAVHGHATRMVEQDDFGKLVAHLNPVVKVPSHYDLMWKTFDLFDQEKSKLKEKLTALSCRVCLSAYIWHYDPLLAFFTEELSSTILWAIGAWGLDDKVFCIILDDAFVDDSVASNVKTGLQKRNKVAANKSLFVARYATHVLDEVIQVGLDELDTVMEKFAKCSSSKGFVGSNYLEVVATVSRIKDFNWAQFTLEHLLENLASFKTNKRTGLSGNLALLQVITELEPNESKVRTDKGNSDQGIDDQYNDRMRHDNFENEDWNENVEQDKVNRDGVHDAMKDNETKMKESMDSMKILLEKYPELHTVVQMLVAGCNMSTKREGKQCDSSDSSKPRESYFSVHEESEREFPVDNIDKSEEVNPCPQEQGTADEIHVDNMDKSEEVKACPEEPGTADETVTLPSNISSAAKRKNDVVSSPTLVEKVKTRTNRQPSKVCKSPYADTKQKRVSKEKKNGVSVGEVTKGLKLSDLEVHAITFVLYEIATHPNNDIIIDSYVTMFNSDWEKGNKEMKHAISAVHMTVGSSSLDPHHSPPARGQENARWRSVVVPSVGGTVEAALPPMRQPAPKSVLQLWTQPLIVKAEHFILPESNVQCMEDVIDNVNNDIVEQEESTGSIPSPLLRSTRPNKRLRSKVWDDFIPTFVDGKA